jgi:hypothetical protein
MLNVEWTGAGKSSRLARGIIPHSTSNIEHLTFAVDSAKHRNQQGEKQ